MKKVTKYRVSGISNTKPEVSKDFTVTEIVEEVPMDDLTVESTRGNYLTVAEEHDGTAVAKVSLGGSYRKLDVATATEVRDWLTEFIDSNTSLKVYGDRDGSFSNLWYELSNGRYVYCSSREDANRMQVDNDTGWTFERVSTVYGPLTLIKQ